MNTQANKRSLSQITDTTLMQDGSGLPVSGRRLKHVRYTRTTSADSLPGALDTTPTELADTLAKQHLNEVIPATSPFPDPKNYAAISELLQAMKA